MEMQLLPWIKDDVAIEIISKMIGEQVTQLYQLVDELKHAGFNHDSQKVVSDPRYRQLMARISDLKNEIDQIYNGDRLEEIHKKVDGEYVPHLNRHYTGIRAQSGTVRFFDETQGFGFIKPDGSEDTFVQASDSIKEDKHSKPDSKRQANEYH
jgi:hypothetical protein